MKLVIISFLNLGGGGICYDEFFFNIFFCFLILMFCLHQCSQALAFGIGSLMSPFEFSISELSVKDGCLDHDCVYSKYPFLEMIPPTRLKTFFLMLFVVGVLVVVGLLLFR